MSHKDLIQCSFLIIPVSSKKILNSFVQRFGSVLPHVGNDVIYGYYGLLSSHAGIGHNKEDDVAYG